MKRIALVLALAMLLSLCACGKADAPVSVTEGETTTTTPILEPVLLNVQQEETGKSTIFSTQGMDVESRFSSGSCDCVRASVTLEAFDDTTVSVEFITTGDGWINHSKNTGSAYNRWNEVILYGESYVITSPANSVSYTYTFTKIF